MAFVLKPELNGLHSAEQKDSFSLNMNGLHVNGQDSLVQPLLTDLYQITMCYAYWKAEMHEAPAVFDLYFRKNPFQGEFTIFAGLEDCLRFVENFHFSPSDIEFIKATLPETTEEKFYEFLSSVDCSSIRIEAIREGSVVFPKVPLLTVSGPMAICQLLETTLLNLINYSSLVATNAARFRLAAGKLNLLEFGLRRAQGPNGALSASKYCYVGGFDGTSNVLAGKLFGIPVRGTQAHSFICSFSGEDQLKVRSIRSNKDSGEVDLLELAKEKQTWLMDKIRWGVSRSEVSQGELAAFVAYAVAFPRSFLALIDTYDVLRSGVINFLSVALALHEIGYRAVGIRIDSGDLSYLSKEIRKRFNYVAHADPSLSFVTSLQIVASNDINEETIMSLNEQKHEIDAYGVGTHLVTCQKQPALGCVYKLVSLSGRPKIKLSQDVSKMTIPFKKMVFRIYGKAGAPILDLMTIRGDEDFKHLERSQDAGYESPTASSRREQFSRDNNGRDSRDGNNSILCRHPFEEGKRCLVSKDCRIVRLHDIFWENGKIVQKLPTLTEIREHVKESVAELRPDHKRYLNPTPYKVSVSSLLHAELHDEWLKNAPICQLE